MVARKKIKVRLAGCFSPPSSAHYRYYTQSLLAHPNFKPKPELIAQMDEEQRRYDAGMVDWVVRSE